MLPRGSSCARQRGATAAKHRTNGIIWRDETRLGCQLAVSGVKRFVKKGVFAFLVLAVACTPAEPRVPVKPPASLPRVDLDPVPPKTSLVDEVTCGMTRDEVDAVLARLALSPLRETGPDAYLSKTDAIEAKVTFLDGRVDRLELSDGRAQPRGIVCGEPASPH